MKKPTCFGAGLIALDVIMNGSPTTLPKLSAGGSCGNVLSILGYLGWNSFPIARLAKNQAGAEVIKDFERWQVHIDHLIVNSQGSTPIIIHRILKDKNNKPVHRFEFRDPDTKKWLPQFKPITKHVAADIRQTNIIPEVFYFDRMNPGTLELATHFKSKGAIIYFEPSSAKEKAQFEKFLSVADIIKFSHERIPDYKTRYKSIRCFLEIETQGKDGLLYRSKNNSNPNNWKTISGFQLHEIEDAAGAGDWCTAGIISKLSCGGHTDLINMRVREIEKALQFGQALGALNCLYDGARGLMYYYTQNHLLSMAELMIERDEIFVRNTSTSPRIDISTSMKFSDLYRTID